MAKRFFTALYAKGELTKTGQNYLTALPVIGRLFSYFSREVTHIGYESPSYAPPGYVTHSRVKNKLAKIAQDENFIYFGACSLEKNYQIASQDFKVEITIDLKRNYIVFAVPGEIENIKPIIDEIKILIKNPELVYFKTSASGDILSLAYNRSKESIRGFEELALE